MKRKIFTLLLIAGMMLALPSQVQANSAIEILEEQEVEYKCNCSRERFEKALKSLNKKELDEMAEEMEKAETVCRFCNSVYTFTRDELKSFAKNKKN